MKWYYVVNIFYVNSVSLCKACQVQKKKKNYGQNSCRNGDEFMIKWNELRFGHWSTIVFIILLTNHQTFQS